jgi:hypothetical protein
MASNAFVPSASFEVIYVEPAFSNILFYLVVVSARLFKLQFLQNLPEARGFFNCGV